MHTINDIYVASKIDKKETVADLIKKRKGVFADCYELLKNGVVVPQNMKLKDLVDGNARNLKIQERQVKFIVRLINGTSIPVEFGLSKTIESLKDYLRDVKKVSVDQQQMTLNGRELDNDMTLYDCKITNDSVLCMNVHDISSSSMDVDHINVTLKIRDTTEVRDLIKMWKESDADSYDLVVNGKIIPRNMTLRDANISVHSKIDLKERNFSFSVRLCNGSRIKVDLAPSKTILNLKQHLSAAEKFPICQQRISFNGRDLSDASTLRESGIKNGSDVYMLGRLYGG